MELIDNFNEKLWTNGDATVEDNEFKSFRICQKKAMAEGEYVYALFDEEGDMVQPTVKGVKGKGDPLNGISMIEAKLSEDKKLIIAIRVEEDCILFNTASQ